MATKKEKIESPKNEPAQPTRIFDVAKPGTLPPADATSRPVIVTNRAVLQDPMMVPLTVSDLPASDPAVTPGSKLSTKIVIKPEASESGTEPAADTATGGAVDKDTDGVIEASEKPDQKPAEKPAEKPDEPAHEPAPKSQGSISSKYFKPLSDTVPTKPSETANPASASPAAGEAASEPSTQTDATAQDGETALDTEKNLDKEAAAMEAAAKKQDELDTLVNNKTYFLDINSVERRRSMHVFVYGLLLIVILGFAWLNIALDAGLIQIDGFKALTHFFDTP